MKIYANRLNRCLTIYFLVDQVGFIPGLQAADQIRRAIDLIFLIRSNWDRLGTKRGKLFSLDISFPVMALPLPHLTEVELQTQVSSTSLPSGNIVIHGCKSDLIHIQRGTRQGCPLSPLLYVIAIETLAILIGSNPNNYGISSSGWVHRCALFADDLLHYGTNNSPA